MIGRMPTRIQIILCPDWQRAVMCGSYLALARNTHNRAAVTALNFAQ
ncbi:hypothetical protein SAMN04488005_2482 [Yoonia tamlensis]|uniref:Uncharacterized protein n=1 Tax=Yoonia tamlensis TaxID=390270 RepID=A0A1I6HBQ8_9RHOB|nr:hypothetical protein SAMN04488005_2482 [Yoonia tamlensis]